MNYFLIIGTIVLSVLIIVFIHVLVMGLTSMIFSMKPEINLGIGQKLIRFGNWNIKSIPLGGHLTFKSTEMLKSGSLSRINLLKVQTVGLSAELGLILFGVIIIPTDIVSIFFVTLSQIGGVFISPFKFGTVAVGSIIDFVNNNTLIVILGTIAPKFAVINLFPLRGFNGYAFILFLFEVFHVPDKVKNIYGNFTSLVFASILLTWFIAIITYIINLLFR
jgi:hypothetical protein